MNYLNKYYLVLENSKNAVTGSSFINIDVQSFRCIFSLNLVLFSIEVFLIKIGSLSGKDSLFWGHSVDDKTGKWSEKLK